jgi:hypothetical protein
MSACGANPFDLKLPTPFQRWQVTYWGSTNVPTAAPGFDADGDRMSNWDEFRAGTNPTDPNSVLRLSAIRVVGSDDLVAFSSVTNRSYAVEWADRLSNAARSTLWTTVVSNVSGTGGEVLVTNSNAATLPNRFYRARVLP